MSTLNFPTSPSLNDIYSFGTKTWIWNGSAWQLQASGAINNTPIGNVTPSTGAFTTVSATGNISATGNVAASNVVTTGVLSANTLSIANSASISGNLAMNSRNITGVANPVNAQDAVTKTYVDTLVATGIHFHDPVRVESPVNLNATYNNGTAGVGATLTNAGTQAALIIDGITMVVADRVLIFQQTNQTQNGIYVVTDTGSGSTNWILTRASDADTYEINSANGLSEGSSVFVQEGATGAGDLYTCNTAGVITFGTTNITFAQVSSAQIYSAGTGLALVGTQFSVANTAVSAGSYGTGDQVATFTVNGQGQITAAANTAITANAANLTGTTLNSSVVNSSLTSVGTLGTLSVSGNVTSTGNIAGNFFIGNGSQLTGLSGSYGNANVEAYLPTYTGNLASLQGNITTTANISGNFFIGNGSQLTGLPESYGNANVAAYLPTYTGNLASLQGNITTTANVTAGNITVLGNLYTNNLNVVLNDITNQFDNITSVFALRNQQDNVTNIVDSRDIQVVVGGQTLSPYVTQANWPFVGPFFTPYDSFRGFRVKSNSVSSNVIIYNSPAIGDQATITIINNSTTVQTRRYPYSPETIAFGD